MRALIAAVVAASFAVCAAPASAGSNYYVVVGYANPKLIAGPYASITECNAAASDFSARNSYNPAFHCEYRFSPGSAAEDTSRAYSAPAYTPIYTPHYNVVYHAVTHDRIVSSGYSSFAACSLEAGNYNADNQDYRYGCVIAR